MGNHASGRARAVADLSEGYALATVEVGVGPERVFRALTSKEIIAWWFRPGVFNTTDWTGEVRRGGRWRSEGIGARGPYALEGEFVELEPPARLVHTWRGVGLPAGTTTVSYRLEPIEGGTRITLRHSGFTQPGPCLATAIGWETSFERLADHLSPEAGPSRG